MQSSRRLAALAVMGLGAAGVVGTGSAASADLVTHCVGEAEGVTVPGDMLVPEGESCALQDVTVTGDVQVAAGADLMLSASTVSGEVALNTDAYLDIGDSAVEGDITSTDSFGVFVEQSQAASVAVSAEEATPYLYAFDSQLSGAVDVSAGDVHIESTSIAGAVASANTTFTDIIDSTLAATLSVSGAADGSTICASEVDGAAAFQANTGPVQIGGAEDRQVCTGMNYFGADLTVAENTGGVDVSSNIVRGSLTGEGNDPAPTGEGNRVRGELGGQFTELQPAAELRALARTAEVQDTMLTDRQDRQQSAKEAAAQAGQANL